MIWIGIPLALYGLLCLLVWRMQEVMLFPMANRSGAPVPVQPLPGVTVRDVAFAPGKRCRVAVAEAEDPLAVCVLFMGNGEDLRAGVDWVAKMAPPPYRLTTLAVEFPGYGESDGEPGREAFQAAAEAAALEARRMAETAGVPLIGFGSSMGSFPTVHMARAGLVDGVVLRCPPAAIALSAKERFPYLPTGWLLRHDLDNLQGLDTVRAPLLLVHGEADTTVPIGMGAKIAAAWPAPTTFLRVPGKGHTDVVVPPDAIADLVASIPK